MKKVYLTNLDIRQQIIDKDIYYYQLADRIGISPYTLSMWLKNPLDAKHRDIVQFALDTFQDKER